MVVMTIKLLFPFVRKRLNVRELKSFFLGFQKKSRIAFSDQEGRNELLGGEDSQSSEDQVILTSK